MTKEAKYTALIISQMQAMFEPDSENHIDAAELEQGDNATVFLHALANLAPCYIYQTISGDKPDLLGFNHIANRLVFQFTKEIV